VVQSLQCRIRPSNSMTGPWVERFVLVWSQRKHSVIYISISRTFYLIHSHVPAAHDHRNMSEQTRRLIQAEHTSMCITCQSPLSLCLQCCSIIIHTRFTAVIYRINHALDCVKSSWHFHCKALGQTKRIPSGFIIEAQDEMCRRGTRGS
jgi:hypothetical protein